MRNDIPDQIGNSITFGSRIWTSKELGQMFRTMAQGHAQDMDGPQMFCVFAFYNGCLEPTNKRPFEVSGKQELPGMGTFSTDPKGLIQQGMRHTEIALGMALRHQKDVNDQMITMFKMVGEQNATLMKENIDAMSVVKEVMLSKAQEDSAERMALEEFKRKSKERAIFFKLAPALANRLFGREIFPQSAEDTAIIENITDSMTEEQIGKLMSILSPEQAALLAPLMEKAIKDREAEKQLESHNELDEDESEEPEKAAE
jgi:hypothetical protein